MKHVVLSLSLAAAVVAAAPVAFADQTAMPVQMAAAPDQFLAKQQALESDAVKAFQTNVNPLTAIRSIGIYDPEDAFKGPNGYPLPGTYMYNGDINASGGG